jgi:hypothetical protein
MADEFILEFSLEQVQAIFDRCLADALAEFGPGLKAASNVEHHPVLGGWIADLRRVGGPILGAHVPFSSRHAALDAERRWLSVHLRM